MTESLRVAPRRTGMMLGHASTADLRISVPGSVSGGRQRPGVVADDLACGDSMQRRAECASRRSTSRTSGRAIGWCGEMLSRKSHSVARRLGMVSHENGERDLEGCG